MMQPKNSNINTGDKILSSLSLGEIIDIEALQKLMENFYDLTGFGSAILDIYGKVLVATGWQKICTHFHRAHPEARKFCIESDLKLSSNIEPGKFMIYKCKHNMWDMATPVMIDDRKVGNLYLGQFLFKDEEPDYELFRRQAEQFGFDQEAYLAALEQVPRWDHDELQKVMTFYTSLAGLVSTLSYSNASLKISLHDQKEVETDLRREQREKSLILDNLAEQVTFLDPELHIIWANEGVGKRHGLKSDNYIGKICYHAYHDAEYPCTGCPVIRARKEGKTCSGITRAPDGRYWQTTGSPVFDDNGQLAGFLEASLDITEIKEKEALLEKLNRELEYRVARRTAELEKLNRELDAFAYSVSHDLRAPLRRLKGFSQILEEDYAHTQDRKFKSTLERITTSAKRMDKLVEDLLSLSRVTRQELQFEQVDLSSLADRYFSYLSEREPERKVEMTVAPGLKAQGDSRLLHLALENLLENAWKFTGKSDQARIEVSSSKNGETEIFYVRDNGVGFPGNKASKLFAPFQRLHSEKDYPGTGIGLSIVYRVIERHGGKIWAEGALNKGAAFYFTLPGPG